VTEQNPPRAELTAFKGVRVVEPAPELGEFDRRTSRAQHD